MLNPSENPWRTEGVDGQDDPSVLKDSCLDCLEASTLIDKAFVVEFRSEVEGRRFLPLLASSRPFRLLSVVWDDLELVLVLVRLLIRGLSIIIIAAVENHFEETMFARC